MFDRPRVAAVLGALCLLPFVAANAVVGNRIEPFFSLIRPGVRTSPREYVLLAVLLVLIAIGACIAARPMVAPGPFARPRVRLLNVAVAGLLSIVFLTLTTTLGMEIYRCDVLGVPNCD
jgi:hypothetical protein